MLAVALLLLAFHAVAAADEKGETVTFESGRLHLKGLVFRPSGAGPHPLVVYLHGIGNEYAAEIDAVAAAYTGHGYVLFAPFRRGQGLSADSGPSMRDRLLAEDKSHGEAAARALQAHLMETEQLDDVRAAIDFARTLPDIRKDEITVAGNSFGGALAVLAAARVRGIKAAVASAPAAQAWSKAPEMRQLLLGAARDARAPIFLFQAENDFDTAPSADIAAELARSGKAGERKLYPPFGKTHMDGHHIGYFGASVWADDVFRFLKAHGAS